MKETAAMSKAGEKIAADMMSLLRIANIDPAKDTINMACEKLVERKLTHMVFYLPGGGIFLLCADDKMSRHLRDAIDDVDAKMEELVIGQFGGRV